ncbi:MAG: RrF2 family transcriptional regulator [Clostridia bacterium]|nr:RrF2 family transcriptional regulator [Clostridia bacterium]
MMISTRGRYALRVMIDLAEQKTSNFVPLKEVAERQEISEKYLESIVKNLVQNGYLEGLRGKGGGYRLVREPDSYTVGSILRLMEGSLAPVSCLAQRAQPCGREAVCRTLPMWRKLYEMVNDYFDGITLADLIESGQSGDDYVI